MRTVAKPNTVIKKRAEELFWRDDFYIEELEQKALVYVKKFKKFTPGEVMMFLNFNGEVSAYVQPSHSEVVKFLDAKGSTVKVGYAHTTQTIDTLYAYGYVDQSAFYWEKGEIKYIGR